MADGKDVALGGISRAIVWQLTGLEIVVFGRRRTGGPFPWPLHEVDTYFVRAVKGVPTHDGILRRTPGGDALEMPDGRRLAVSHLPVGLSGAAGMRVWLAGPLDAPTYAGVLDPNRTSRCDE